jgi:hypothetical protein
MKKLILFFNLFFLLVSSVNAQDDSEGVVVEEDKILNEAKSGSMYIKLGTMSMRRKIDGFALSMESISLDLDRYFGHPRFGISGWSVGYRKSDITYLTEGHLINFQMFNKYGISKVGGGIEFGILPLAFDNSRFLFGPDGDVQSYTHLFPHRRGTLGAYPFFELSAVVSKSVLFEAGVRFNILKFGVDQYDISTSAYNVQTRDRTVILPGFFIKFGLGSSRIH